MRNHRHEPVWWADDVRWPPSPPICVHLVLSVGVVLLALGLLFFGGL